MFDVIPKLIRRRREKHRTFYAYSKSDMLAAIAEDERLDRLRRGEYGSRRGGDFYSV